MDYLDLFRDWERTTANPAIFEHIDILFPAYGFRRIQAGSTLDRWVSPLKLDLSQPRNHNPEKTVVGRDDFRFREQGQWDEPVGVMDMLASVNGLGSIYEAYLFAASRLGLSLPVAAGMNGPVNRERSRRYRLLESLEAYFVWNIRNNNGQSCRQTRNYLLSRGFTIEWIDRFRFGFVPSWDKVEDYITSPRLGFTLEELNSVCCVRSESGSTSVGRTHVLAVPYRCAGELKGFLFRAVEESVRPKYKANIGLDRKSAFFNIRESGKISSLLVMEGEIDALTATAAGIDDAVAIGGSDISGERKSMVFDAIGRGVQRIFLCPDLDADADGRPAYGKRVRAVRRSLHTIFDVVPDFREVYIVRFPEPSDPDDFIRRNGAAAFRTLLDMAQPWWKYLADVMESSL